MFPRLNLLTTALRRGTALTAAAANPPEIWLAIGDSRMAAGDDLREAGDHSALPTGILAWRRDTGNLSSTVPLLHYAMGAGNTLSPPEFFAIQRRADTGANIYIDPQGYPGLKTLDMRNRMPDAITEINAVIQAVQAVEPTAVFKGVLFNGGANGDLDATQADANVRYIASECRAKITQNGVSVDLGGTPVGATMKFLMFGMGMPNKGTQPVYKNDNYEIPQMLFGMEPHNAFLSMPQYDDADGVTELSNSLHEKNAGVRWIGRKLAKLLSDTAPVTIGIPDTISTYSDQIFARPITLSRLVGLSAADAGTNFDIEWYYPGKASGLSTIADATITPRLKPKTGTTLAVGSYSPTLTAYTGVNMTNTKGVTVTSVAAYGSTPAASFDPQWLKEQRGIYVTALGSTKSKFTSVALKGGYVNIITCLRPGGVETYGPNAIASNGLIGEASPSNDGSNGFCQFYFYTPVDETVDIYIDTNNSGSPFLSHMALRGTAHSPSSAVASANANDSITVPSGGIAIDAGYSIGDQTPPSGGTALTNPLPDEWPARGSYRTTTGLIGGTSTGGNGKHFASAWPAAT